MQKIIFKIISGFAGNLIQIIISLFPIDKNKMIFGSWGGLRYADNPKYLFRHISRGNYGKKCIWIVKNKKIIEDIRSDGGEAHYYISLRGLLYQARAAAVFYTHQVNGEFLSFFVHKKAVRIQLFHGIPLKKIDYDDTRFGNPKRKARLKNTIFPHLTDKCDLVMAASQYDAEIFKRAFNVESQRVIITGYPRHDVISRDVGISDLHSIKKQSRILYLPTYRGDAGSAADPFASDESGFAEFLVLLKALNAELCVKLHPAQRPSDSLLKRSNSENCIKLFDAEKDLYEEIGDFDILITDFSSVYFDFLLANKPIVLAAFEKEEYINRDRHLYCDLNEVACGPIAYDFEDLIRIVKNIYEGDYNWDLHTSTKKYFHQHNDQHACLRVAHEVLRLIHG